MLWSEFRTALRRSVLKDESALTWSNEALLDVCKSALDVLAAHTAVATGAVLSPASSEYTLPSNLYGSLEETGALFTVNASSQVTRWYVATYFPEEVYGEYLFRTWGDRLILTEAPADSDVLELRYFAYYDHPISDNSVLGIPRWSNLAFSYLMAAIALTPVSMQSSNINQWKTKTDSGQPEQNALKVAQDWMYTLYEREIARYPRQDRKTYFGRPKL